MFPKCQCSLSLKGCSCNIPAAISNPHRALFLPRCLSPLSLSTSFIEINVVSFNLDLLRGESGAEELDTLL